MALAGGTECSVRVKTISWHDHDNVQATERLSPNAFKTVIDIVLNGTFNVTLEFGKRLIAAKQGALY